MTDSPDRWHEFDLLVDRLLDGLQSEDDARRLNELLRTDPDARRRYVGYVGVHGRLSLCEGGADLRCPATNERLPSHAGAGSSRGADHLPVDCSPLPMYRLPIGGGMLAYLAALGMMATAIAAAAMWKSPADPQRPAAGGPLAADARPVATDAPAALIVAHVTGAADCRWAEPGEAAAVGAAVPLGREFALKSGVLEITYLGGERVILQGPARYQVRWPNGGMLWEGKLTAFAVNPAWTQPARPPDGSPWLGHSPTGVLPHRMGSQALRPRPRQRLPHSRVFVFRPHAEHPGDQPQAQFEPRSIRREPRKRGSCWA